MGALWCELMSVQFVDLPRVGLTPWPQSIVGRPGYQRNHWLLAIGT